MKSLPFCAKCGKTKDNLKHDATAFRDYGKFHEFVPCYSAKEVDVVVEKLELELARVREKVREGVRD